MVLSSWPESLREFTGFTDECRLSAGWPPTLRPSQSTWAVSLLKTDSYHPHPPSPLLLLLSPSYFFYRPTESGGLSRPRHCSRGVQPVPKALFRSCCRNKHNRPRCDSNLGPLTPQSDALITRPLRPDSSICEWQPFRFAQPGFSILDVLS